MLSLDGLGHKILATDPAARELRSLHALAARGAFRPLRTSFPSKTSAGHAAIFTGKWAGENGVFSNTNPRVPRAAHRFDESITGFRSESLAAEPVWTTAARRGHRAVAYQPTQAFPFTALSAGLDLARPPVVVNGYQTKLLAPHRAVRPGHLEPAGPNRWTWRDGSLTFTIERAGGRALRVSHAGRSVRVNATRFSALLPVGNTGAYFRLFETGDNFLLYRTSIHEPGVSGADAAALQRAAGAFVGNTPTALYRAGGLGTPVYQGGDGAAERRYLECFAFVTQLMTNQMLWLDQQFAPRLFVGYYPQADDLEHVFYGLSRTLTRTSAAAVDETRRQAYALLDAGLARLLRRFPRIVVTSDHGMSPATHEVHMGALLAELGWPPTHARANASCVFLNTADWKEGLIPLAEAAAERQRLAQALARHPLITRVYPYSELPNFGLTGDRQPDACFEIAPMHYPVESAEAPIVVAKRHAEGEHGFDPAREEMRAIFLSTERDSPFDSVTGIAALVLSLLR